jgi:hypothetical protein
MPSERTTGILAGMRAETEGYCRDGFSRRVKEAVLHLTDGGN